MKSYNFMGNEDKKIQKLLKNATHKLAKCKDEGLRQVISLRPSF